MKREKYPIRIAFREWDTKTRFYVANLPGHDGKDWGYSKGFDKAIPLTDYWQRRFKNDMKRVGSIAYFISFDGEESE